MNDMINRKNHFTFIAYIAQMVLCIIILSSCWTTATMANVVFQDEILYIDDIPTFLLSADYPYYRDHRNDWSGQLDMIKSMGVKIITCYLPWRHHAPNDPLHGNGFYDFTGHSQSNRDVKYFLDLIRQKELMAIIKPGPFIHAEVDYGAIPDYISQAIESGLIEAEKDCSGLPTQWQQPLLIKFPAALDPYYHRLWLPLSRPISAILVKCLDSSLTATFRKPFKYNDYLFLMALKNLFCCQT